MNKIISCNNANNALSELTKAISATDIADINRMSNMPQNTGITITETALTSDTLTTEANVTTAENTAAITPQENTPPAETVPPQKSSNTLATNLRAGSFVVVLHEQNFINLNLSASLYNDPKQLAEFLKQRWEKSGNSRFAAVAVCRSAEGRYHAHMAVYGNDTTMKKVSERLGNAHVDIQQGTREQVIAYMRKTGEHKAKGETVLYEIGIDEIPEKHQGARNDLQFIGDLLEEGWTPEQIFSLSFSYRRYEKMIQAHYMQIQKRNAPLVKQMTVEWHVGQSGSGKTFSYVELCKRVGRENVYFCSDFANYKTSASALDEYEGEKYLFCDEVRGEDFHYNQMLGLLDHYSLRQQHCRFRNKYQTYDTVIISSIQPPEIAYENMVPYNRRSYDTMTQLMRRINTVVYHWVTADGEYRTFSIPAKQYTNYKNLQELAHKNETAAAKSKGTDEFEPADTMDNPFHTGQ